MTQTLQSDGKAYLVLGCKPWNRQIFDEVLSTLAGTWRYLDDPKSLRPDLLRKFTPRYLFFLHWSWKVPPEIFRNFECVCFHMTDVPYGRGGSPLQNLIARGHCQTQLTALQMTDEMDGGPVYMKQSLSLEGSAEEIYVRAAKLSASMIQQILRDRPEPVPQRGPVVQFRRRKPQESELGGQATLEGLYDFIRMLDADGYPRAFLNHNGFRFEFSRAVLSDGHVAAEVEITSALDWEANKG